MNLSELNAELSAIKKQGNAVIDGATPKSILGAEAKTLAAADAAKITATRRTKTKSWFGKLIDGLLETIRQAICCHGYTEIDTEEERKALAEKLLKAVLDATPLFYRLIAKLLLKRLIRRAIRLVLDYLSTLGTKMCKGVVCSLSPLTLR